MFDFYKGKIKLENGPGCYKVTEDPLWLLSVLPLDKSSYLEVGCASGVMSLILRLKNPTAKITAVDIQNEMVEQAVKHAKINNIDGIDFKQQDLYDISDDEKYDCVFSNPPFLDCCKCQSLKDGVRDKAYVQQNMAKFINKLIALVKDDGLVCFMGHISTRDDILLSLDGNVDVKEISIVSSVKKGAKRFIYIVKKSNKASLEQYKIESFDETIRQQILFLYNSLHEKSLKSV